MTAPRPRRDRISRHDAAFLYSSSPLHPMHVAALVLFDDGPGAAALDRDRMVRLLRTRLHLLPRFRQVLARVPGDLEAPVWVDDQSFDLDRHVLAERVAAPGDERALTQRVARLHLEPFPVHRPLWAAHLLEYDAQVDALLFRWHHALVDGMSGVAVAYQLFDDRPSVPDGEPRPWHPSPPPRPTELLMEAIEERLTGTPREGAASPEAEGGLRDLDFLDGWLELLDVRREGEPIGRDPSAPSRFAWTGLPEPGLRGVARDHDVSLHRVFLTLVGGALARLSAARGEERRSLRALIPVAIEASDRHRRLGNHAAFTMIALPVGPMDEDQRLQEITARYEAARRSPQADAVAHSLGWLETIPLPLHRRLAEFTRRVDFADLVISYMPGPVGELWLAGARHHLTIPMLPITRSIRLAVGGVRLGEQLGVGIRAGVDAVPEVEFFVHALEQTARRLTTR